MKNLQELIEPSPVFVGNFNCSTDVLRESGKDSFGGFRPLLAIYILDSWQGEAYILLEKDGKLYENEIYHCSCYGLEDLLNEDLITETSIEELEYRIKNGEISSDWKQALIEFLNLS